MMGSGVVILPYLMMKTGIILGLVVFAVDTVLAVTSIGII